LRLDTYSTGWPANALFLYQHSLLQGTENNKHVGFPVCCCCRWFEQAGARQASCLFYPQPIVVETVKLFAKLS
jgi:hypothetical protein